MADEQYRVAWGDRAAYLAVLADLKRAVDRECDAVQVGAPETVRFGQMLDEIVVARGAYAGCVQEMKDRQPPMPVD